MQMFLLGNTGILTAGCPQDAGVPQGVSLRRNLFSLRLRAFALKILYFQRNFS